MLTTDPLAPVAARLGLAPGALYTLIVGFLIASVLTMSGPPAAFATRTTVAPNSGLGNLAAAPAAPLADTPAVAPAPTTTTTIPLVVSNTPIPAPTPAPAPRPAPTFAPPTTSRPATSAGPALGDVVTDADVPGTVTAITVVADGVLAAVDRDDADPLIVRVDKAGDVVGSIVIGGRDLTSDTDIVDLAVDSQGRVFALMNGPTEVIRLSPDGKTVESLGAMGDLPPCGVPLGLPVAFACESGTTDGEPLVDSIAVAGDTVLVSDPGQGVLWIIDGDGGIAAGAIDETYRGVDDDVVGLRGVAATNADTVIGTVNDELVEFTITPESIDATVVASLPSVASRLDRSPDTFAVLLGDGDVIRLDASYSALPTLGLSDSRFTDVAISADGLWTARPGGVSSDIRRHFLESSS